jgi:hypothetical protein
MARNQARLGFFFLQESPLKKNQHSGQFYSNEQKPQQQRQPRQTPTLAFWTPVREISGMGPIGLARTSRRALARAVALGCRKPLADLQPTCGKSGYPCGLCYPLDYSMGSTRPCARPWPMEQSFRPWALVEFNHAKQK